MGLAVLWLWWLGAWGGLGTVTALALCRVLIAGRRKSGRRAGNARNRLPVRVPPDGNAPDDPGDPKST